MMVELFPWEELVIGALYEANKLDLASQTSPINNIDILKYMELFKQYHKELFDRDFAIRDDIIMHFKTPMKYIFDKKIIPLHEQNQFANSQMLQEIFIYVNRDYEEYLKEKYLERGKIFYLDDYRQMRNSK